MIFVIHPRVIKGISSGISRDGKINLRGLFGKLVNADLVTVFIKLSICSTKSILVVMAMTSFANTYFIHRPSCANTTVKTLNAILLL